MTIELIPLPGNNPHYREESAAAEALAEQQQGDTLVCIERLAESILASLTEDHGRHANGHTRAMAIEAARSAARSILEKIALLPRRLP
jgi:hypothetical protein